MADGTAKMKPLLEDLDESSTQRSAERPKLTQTGLPPQSVFADRYRILEKIGEGGMGSVYKVKHVHMGNVLALKILNSRSTTAEVVRRFEQEARVVSRMKHPNIVAIHDFGIVGAEAYLVMDYLEGHNLGDIPEFSKGGAISIERFLRLMIQACSALAHAHENGVVHRDLKPGNIIVVPAEGTEQAVLVDFGIAKVMPREDETQGVVTQTGDVIGSPCYMSPEQCQSQAIDLRSDIYSLGCVMYELLVGQPPFRGENVLSTVFMHMNAAPKRFPARLRESLLQRQLEAIVLKSLAKSPDDRYQSTLELASDLKQAQRCSNGMWSNIKTFFKTAKAHRNSAHKMPLLQRHGVALLSGVAMFTAMALLWLPAQLSDSTAKVHLDEKLQKIVYELLSAGTQTTFPTAESIEKEGLRSLDSLSESFRAEPEKLELIRNVEKLGKNSLSKTQALHEYLKHTLANPFSIFQSGRNFDVNKTFLDCGASLTKFMMACTELEAAAYRDLTQQQLRLQTCSRLFLVLWFAGIGFDAVLLIVLLRRFGSKLLASTKQS